MVRSTLTPLLLFCETRRAFRLCGLFECGSFAEIDGRLPRRSEIDHEFKVDLDEFDDDVGEPTCNELLVRR